MTTDKPAPSFAGESQSQQELSRVQAKYMSLKTNYDNVSTDLMSREMEIEGLQEQLASGEPGFGLENPSADLQSEVDRLNEERSTMLSTVEGLKSDIAAKETIENELTRLQVEVGEMSAENERLLQQLQNSADAGQERSRVEELTQELETMAKQYQEAETQRKQSTSHFAALGKTLKRAEESAEEQKDRASTFESELNSAHAELKASMEDTTKATTLNGELERKCAELEAALSLSENELQTSTAQEISLPTSKCRDLQDEVNRYREMEKFTAQQLEETEEAARQQAQAYTDQITHLTTECERLQQDQEARNQLDAATPASVFGPLIGTGV